VIQCFDHVRVFGGASRHVTASGDVGSVYTSLVAVLNERERGVDFCCLSVCEENLD